MNQFLEERNCCNRSSRWPRWTTLIDGSLKTKFKKLKTGTPDDGTSLSSGESKESLSKMSSEFVSRAFEIDIRASNSSTKIVIFSKKLQQACNLRNKNVRISMLLSERSGSRFARWNQDGGCCIWRQSKLHFSTLVYGFSPLKKWDGKIKNLK